MASSAISSELRDAEFRVSSFEFQVIESSNFRFVILSGGSRSEPPSKDPYVTNQCLSPKSQFFHPERATGASRGTRFSAVH